MKAAYKKNEELIEEILGSDEDTKNFHIWWLGQSGFLIKWGEKFILLDPYLSDSLTKKYSDTDKPHERITEKVINPSRLNFINIITSSHNHTDHLDGETLNAMSKADREVQLVLPQANIEFAEERLGKENKIRLIGITEENKITIDGFTITGIAAAHNEIERDENGHPKFMSLIISFGKWNIYHSGDTLWHPQLTSELLKFSIDVAIVPINGNKAERRVAGNLNGYEAAALSRAVNAGIAIPHHFDMFKFNTASPEEFISACEGLNQNFKVLRNGQRWSFSELELD